MKKLIAATFIAIAAIAVIVITSVTTAQVKSQPADTAKGFDVALFQRALVDEMYIQFPALDLDLDTTLNYILRARSQESVGYPSAYHMKNGGNANISANEKEEAKRVVKAYKDRLAERHFTESDLARCGFNEFAALAIKVNGSVQYALVVDNNFKAEDIVIDGEKLNKELEGIGFTIKN
jgi:hypothetical protein